MKTLVMDTSNTYLVVALFEQGICIESVQEKGNKKQSEYAILKVKEILNHQQLTMLDIDEMVITIGPGSYTGVRVALTIAKTLASVTDIKIKCVSSLQAYAGNEDAISVLDARSNKVFVGGYSKGKTIVPETMIAIEEFSKIQKQYPDLKVVGDSYLVGYEDQGSVSLAENIYALACHQSYVQNIDTLVPHYIKEVEAKKIC